MRTARTKIIVLVIAFTSLTLFLRVGSSTAENLSLPAIFEAVRDFPGRFAIDKTPDTAVLQASTKLQGLAGEIAFNLPSKFNEEVLVDAAATVSGTLTAPNIIYGIIAGDNITITDGQTPTISANFDGDVVTSFQGQTGELALAEGDGISINGLTITNDDPGSAQNIFKTIIVSGTSLTASSNTDTVEFEAGTGISLSTSDKTITIASTATNPLSGLTTNGVLYADSSTTATSLTPGTSGYILQSNGAGSPPTWVPNSAGGAISVSENGTTVVTTLSNLDFLGGDFDVTEAPTGEANIQLASTLTSVTGVSGGFSTGSTLTVGTTLTLGGDTVSDITGSGLGLVGSVLGVNLTTSGTTGLASSNSGLEVSSAGLTLLKGCADTQVLSWNDGSAVWECTNQSGGGSTNFWQRNNGAVAPAILSNDLLLGATATDSARFGFINVGSGTPTATMSAGASGGLYITANGTISTTAQQMLTLGGSTTGDILLSPNAGNNKVLSTGTLSLSTGKTFQINGTDVLTGNTLGSGVISSSLTSVGALNAGSITSGFGSIDIGGDNLTAGGTITFSGLTTNGGLLYTNGSGVVAQTAAGSNGQCLVSNGGGAPSWTTCPGSSTANYWQLNNGTISPFSNTLDLLVGGTASSSAKFAVLNVNSGTPTASVSAGANGAAYLTAAGNLATTNLQTLTIGGSTTGNIILSPTGGTNTVLSTGSFNLATGKTFQINGTDVLSNNTLGTGVLTSSLTTVGALNSGSITSGFGSIDTGTDDISGGTITATSTTGFSATGNGAGLGFSGSGNHDITASVGTLRLGAATLTGAITGNSQSITGLNALSASGTITFGGLSTGVVQSNGSGVLSSAALNLAGGASLITGTLPVGNGGTGVASVGSAGSVTYSNGSTYAFTGVGSSGQVLISNGSGTPTWADSSSIGTNYWQRLSGAISPINITDDLLIGGTATASAKFQVFANSGNATTSGSFTFNTAGNIQTTANQALTIGGATTGNITLSPLNGSGTVNSTGDINLSSGKVFQINGTSVLSNNTLGSGVIASSLTSVGALNAGSITSGFGSIDIGGDNLTAGGTITFSGLTTNGGLLYTNGSGVVAQTTAGSGGQCLISNGGGAPSWTTCPGSSTANYWQLNNGTVSPFSNTLDLLVGGTASNSAKFAVLNVNSGTPTASVSAGTNGAAYLTADGNLQTTANQNLTLGGSTTGNITLSPLNGSGTVTSTGNMNLASSKVYQINGTSVLSNNTLGSGVLTSSLTTVGALASGSITSGFGTISTTNTIQGSDITASGTTGFTASGNDADITFSNAGNHDITASSGTLRLGAATLLGTITGNSQSITGLNALSASGTITFGGLTTNGGLLYTNGSGVVAQTAAGSAGQCLQSNGGGSPIWATCDAASAGYWSLANGALYTSNNSTDLLVGGAASSSAKFAVLNVNSGTPTASVSAGSTGATYIASDGTLQTTANQNLTIGGSTTGNITLSPLNGSGTVTSTGNLNLSSGKVFQINGTSVLSNNTLGSGVTTSSLTTVGALNSGSITSGFGAIDIGADALTAGGTITFGGLSTGVVQSNGSGVLSSSALNLAGGASFITGTLPVGNGGTGAASVGSAGSIAYSNGSTYAFSGVGSSGQLLVSNGSGAPTWADASSVGTNYWQRISGAISPLNITDDLLIGGTATASAKFQVFANTGNATTSGNFTFNTAGNIQTTANQILTIGGNTTGNIVLSPLNGSGTVTSTGNVNLSTGKTFQINGTDVLSANTLGSSVIASSLTSVGALNAGSITSGFGSIDIGGDNLTAGGTITFSGLTTNGGLLYTNGSGVVAQTAAGSAGQCLQSNGGGSPIWATCDAASAGYWSLANGALYTSNNSTDLLVGGAASSSAKFAVLNVNSGTPTASVSAGSAGAAYITANGTLQTTANQNLTLGGSTTGNITLSPLNGSGTVTSTGNLNLASGKAYQINGTSVLSNNTLGSGVTTSSLTTVGALNSGSITSGFGAIDIGNDNLTSSGTITFGSLSTGVVFSDGSGVLSSGPLNLSNGSSYVTGTLPVGNGGTGVTSVGSAGSISYSNGSTYAFTGVGSSGQCLVSNGGSTPTWASCDGVSAGYWSLANGALYTSNNTTDLLVGGAASTSAKFAVLNVNSGTPTASVSAGSAGAAYITANGTLQTTANQALTIGGNTTGDITLSPLNGSGTVTSTGSLNLSSGKVFQINGTSVLSNNTLGSGVIASSLTSVGALNGGSITSGFGSIDIGGDNLTAGGTITFSGLTTNGGLLYTNGSGVVAQTAAGSAGQCLQSNGGGSPIWATCDAASAGYWSLANGALYTSNNSTDLLVGGAASSSAKFAVLNVNSGTPTASVSAGSTGGAYLTADGTLQTTANQNLTIGGATTGNITLSPLNGSGTVTSTGNVNLASGKVYQINGTSVLSNNTLGSGVTTSSLTTVGALNSGTITSGFGSIDIGADALTAGGTITFGGLSTGVVQSNGSGVLSSSALNLAGGALFITGTLPVGNGGTGVASVGSAGSVTYSNGSTYAFTGVGNSGQLLVSNGSGAPTWIDASSVGTNYWQRISGAISPSNITDDLLIGGTATASAKFQVFANSGNATTSGSFTFNTAGNIQTTANQTLTIGGATTGNITLSPLNGSGTVTSTGNVNLASGKVFQINGADVLSATTLGSNVIASSLTSVGALNAGSITSGFGSIDIGGDNLTAGGTITFSGLTTNGGLLYTNGSGVVAQTAAGSAGQCLQSNGGGSPIWAACDSASASYWSLANGALFTSNTSTDLLVGGSASNSAKFAVLNVNSGTPTASVSAGSAGAAYITANGTLQTTANQNLTIGGATTGNITLSPLNGSGTVLSTGNVNLASGKVYQINGTSVLSNNTLGSGVVTSSLTTVGALASGSITSGFGTILTGNTIQGSDITASGTTGFTASGNDADLTFSSTGNHDITASSGTLRLGATTLLGTISGNGQNILGVGSIGIGTSSPLGALDVRGNSGTIPAASISATSSFAALITDNAGVGDLFTASKSGATKFVIMNNGNLGFTGTSSVLNTITTAATASRTYNFPDSTGTVCLVEAGNCAGSGGGITGSGTAGQISFFNGAGSITSETSGFAWDATNNKLGIGNDSPVGKLDISGNVTGKALSIFNQTGDQNIITASTSGVTKFNVNNNGNLQFAGSTSFLNTLTSLATASRTYTFPDSTGTVCLAEAGNCAGSGGGITGSGTAGQIAFFNGSGSITSETSGFAWDATNNKLGIGNDSPVAKLDIAGAVTGKALAIFNETGDQNILTGSASGTTRFAFDRSGNLNLVGGAYQIGGTNVLTSNTLGSGVTTSSLTTVGALASGSIASGFGTISTTNTIQGSDITATGTTGFTLSGSGADITFNASGTHTISASSGTLELGAATLTGAITGNSQSITGLNALSASGTITFGGLTTNGGLLYTNGSGVVAQTAAGSAGQCLQSNGGGSPIWATCDAASAGYWSLANGALYTSNNTTDLLVGGSASSSAKFAVLNVNSGTPTASVSAGSTGAAYITADGNIQTTANQALTIGGATTGNITLSPLNGSGTVTSTGNVNLSSGKVYQINGTSVLSNNTLGSGILTSSLTTVGALNAGSITSGFGSIDIGGDNLTAGGTITFSALTTNGGLLYTNGSGVVAQTAAGSAGQCLISNGGGAPSWTTCPGSSTANYWQLNNGTVSPFSNTLDLLVGGTASNSAKFAVLNVNSGTPTASVSAGAAGAAYLTADGTLQTTANQNLTLGGSTTGNITLSPLNGSGTVTSTGNLNLASGKIFQINGTSVLSNNTLGTGVLTSSLTTVGALNAGSITSGFGSIDIGADALTAGGAITFSGLTTNGGLLYTNGSGVVAQTAAGSAGQCLQSNGGGSPIWATCDAASAGYWSLANGALYTSNNSTDLLVGGAASTSAKFAVLNVNSGTPTASLSAGAAGGSYLTADGTLQTTANQALTIGGATTGNITLSPLNGSGTVTSTGNVNLASGKVYQINGTSVLSNNTLGSGVTTSSLTTVGALNSGSITSGFGSIDIGGDNLTAGGTITFSGLTTNGGLLYTNGSGVVAQTAAGSAGQCLQSNGGGSPVWSTCDAASAGYWSLANGALYTSNNSTDLLVGGAASSSAKFAVLNVNSGTPTASVSAGTNGAAYLTADGTLQTTANQNLTLGGSTTGNITLSPLNGSGTVTSTGNVNLASGKVFQINGTSVLSNNTLGTGVLTSSLTTVGALNAGSITSGFGAIDIGADALTAGGTITFSGLTTNGGLLYTNGSGVVAQTAAGSAGQCLQSNGGGSPIWATCDAASAGYWSLANGALYTSNNSTDLLVGGAASSSAKFAVLNVNSGTPTASVSAGSAGGAYLTADGTLQTTANQNLTLGGATTGNITLSPLNGSGTVLSTGNLNLASGKVFQINGTSVLSNNTLGTGVLTSSLTTVGALNAGSITSGFGAIDIGADALTAGGTITFSGLTTNGGLLYTNGSGVVAQTAAGTAGQCLQSNGGGSPIWATCDAASAGYWSLANGALYTSNNTTDLLVGGSASTSAKFAVLNVNSGTPTASVSAGSAGGSYLTATGTLQTTANQNLTIGGSTTGNITLSPLNGSGTVNSTGNLNLASGKVFQINGTSVLSNNTLGTGVLTSSLTTVGALNSGSITSGFGSIDIGADALTAGGTITFSGLTTNGGLLYTNGTGVVAQTAAGTAGQCLQSNGGGSPVWAACDAASAGYWSLANGALYTSNTSTDLLVGGSASNSAKFAVLNVNSGTPTASVSAGSTGAAYITADGNIQTTANQALTIGGNTTGDITLSPLNGSGTVTSTGSLNLASGKVFQINGTSVLSNNTLGTGVLTSSLTTVGALNSGSITSGFGAIDIGADALTAGGTITFGGLTTNGGLLYTNGSGVVAQTAAGSAGQCLQSNGGGSPIWATCDAASAGYWSLANGALYNSNLTTDLLIGGSASTSALFKVSPSGTSPTASIAANSSSAGLVVDNRGVGDLFTASKSGATKFVITNSGNVGIGTSLPTAKLGFATDTLASGGINFGGDTNLYRSAADVLKTDDAFQVGSVIQLSTSGTVFASNFNNIASGNNANVNTATTGTTISRNVADSNVALIVSQTNAGSTGDILQLKNSGSTVFSVAQAGNITAAGTLTGLTGLTSSGTITFSGLTTNGGLLYTNGSGVVAQTAAGTAGQCLQSNGGGSPIWATCDAASAGYWSLANGALFTSNNTTDLLVGGTASNSAKFAVLNVNSGTPTASVSAGTNGAAYITADGTLQTTANQNLTIGGSTTGNITLSPLNGSGTVLSTGNLNLASGKVYQINGTSVLSNNTLGTGVLTSSLTTVGALNAGSITSGFGAIDIGADALTAGGTITFGGLTTNGGLLYTNGSGVVAQTAAGTAGQCLQSNGGGSPIWATCDAASAGYWSLANGALYTSNNSTDLLVGGAASSSAKFAVLNVNSGTPTASVSAGSAGAAYITADGTLQTTANQNLTIGGATTGNITLSPLNGSGTVLSTGNVNLSSGKVYQINGTSVLSNNTLGSGVTTSSLTTVGALNSGSITSGFGAIDIGADALTAGGTITFSGLTTNGGLLYTNGSGVVAQTAAGNSGECLISNGGGAPSWTTCPGSSTANYWQLNNGTVSPFSNTLDLLVGGTASTSAKFAVLNVNSGTPTASVSAGSAGAAYLTADGNFQTTANQNLTLGGATTGNITLSPLNGSGTVLSTGNLNLASGKVFQINGTSVLSNNTLGTGVLTSSLTTVGALNAGSITSGFGAIDIGGDNLTAGGTITFSGLTTNGGLLYTNGSGVVAQTAAGSAGQCLQSNGGGAPTWAACDAASAGYWSLANGALYTSNNTTDLLVGGTASNSAKFAVLNVNSGTPTASLSAGAAGGSYLTADGTLQTTANQNLTIGGSTTGNITLSPLNGSGTVLSTGNLNLASGKVFQINGTSVLSASTLGTGVLTSSLTTVGALNAGSITSGFGAIDIGADALTAGGSITFSGLTTNGGLLYTNGTGVVAQTAAGTAGQCLQSNGGGSPIWAACDAASAGYWSLGSGALFTSNSTVDLLVGGSASTAAVFKVSPSGTSPTASIAANSSYAGLVTDNRGVGDLFTASKSGATQFVINNSGNVGIGTTNPVAKLVINGAGATATTLSSVAIKPNIINTATTMGIYSRAGAASLDICSGNSNTRIGLIGAGTASSGDLCTGQSLDDIVAGVVALSPYNSSSPTTPLLAILTGNRTAAGNYKIASFQDGASEIAYFGNGRAQDSHYLAVGADRLVVSRGNGSIGIGTATPLAALDVRVNTATTSAASVSGSTNFASMVVDQSGTGDLFTASKSGATKFSILNNGNISFAGTTNFLNTISTAATAARSYVLPDASGTVCLQSSSNCGFGLGTNYWNLASGALAPINSTLDLLVGGTASTAAKFAVLNVNSGTPTASLSAGTAGGSYITADGTLQTTANQNLTLGGATTGNITLSPLNGSGTVLSTGNVNLASGKVFQINGTSVLSNNTLGTGVLTSSLTTVGALNAGSITSGFGAIDIGADALTAGGTITFSGLTTNGGLLYTNGSGVVAQTAAGSNGQCLLGGTTPSWGTCGLGTNYWNLSSGAIAPINSTLDLLVGGTASTAAKFAVLNVNSGTPTASLSAGAAGGSYLTADGKLATTAKQTLTLGDSTTTGNVIINPSGKIGIGNSSPVGKLDLAGAATGKALAIFNETGDQNIFTASASGTTVLNLDRSGNLALEGALSDLSGTSLTINDALQVLSTNESTFASSETYLYLQPVTSSDTAGYVRLGGYDSNGTAGARDLALQPSGGNVGIGNTSPTSMFSVGSSSQFQVNSSGAIAAATGITSSGTITFSGLTTNGGLLYTNGSGVVAQSPAGNNGECLISSGGGSPTWAACPGGSFASQWQLNNGAISPFSNTLDLLVGNIASTSAKFAVLNVNSGTPTASLSAGTAGGSYLTADGTLQTTANQNLTLGGSTTGNITLSPLNGSGTVLSTGNLNLASGKVFQINGTSVLSNNTLGTGVLTSSLTTVGALNAGSITSGFGAIDIGADALTAGGTITFSGLTTNGGLLYTNGTGVVAQTAAGTSAQCLLGGTTPTWGTCGLGTNYWNLSSGAIAPINSTLDLLVGGTASTSAKFKISPSGTSPTASVAASSSFAGLLVDQAGLGDIFTASKSGATKLTLTNSGNLTLSTNNAYQINGTNVLSASTLGSGVTTSSLTNVGALASGSIANGFGNINIGSSSLTANGTITFGGLTTNGGLLYTNGSGVVTQTAAGTSAQCLLGGTAPAWGTCGLGTNYWNATSGALAPINSTLDMLVGGTASTSAKFAVLNVNSGTPTASLSAGASGGSYFTAAGTMQTTNNQLLTIGGNTTGNIALNPLNGAGTVTVDGGLVASGTSGEGFSGAGLTDCDASGSKLLWDATSKLFSCGTDRASFTAQKASDQTNSTSTPVSDSDFTFPVGAGETWVFQINANAGVSATTNTLGFSIDAPASTTCRANVNNIYNFTNNTTTDCDNTPTVMAVANGTTLGEQFIIWARVTTTNSGNVTLKWSRTGGAATMTMYSGSFMTAYKVNGADLAEAYYSKDASIEPGDVVMVDGSLKAGVQKTANPYDSRTMGIVSTQPGHVLGDDTTPEGATKQVLLALAGRVPVKVTSENGPIEPGDYLTTSSTPGVAMKATKPGQVIGKAMEAYDNADKDAVGKVMVFTNLSWADPSMHFDPNGEFVAESIDNQPAPQASSTSDLDLSSLSASVSALKDTQDEHKAKIDSLESKVASLEAMSPFPALPAGRSDFGSQFSASSSAELGLDSLDANDITVSNSLSVMGKTTLNDLGVTGNMTAGVISIHGLEGELNTLAGPLKLQSNGLNGIDLIDGKIAIDNNGNMNIKESLTAKVINTTKLNILQDTLGASTATISSASAGLVTIDAGDSSVDVDTSALTTKSLIFATPDDPVSIGTKAKDKNTFTIKIAQPQANPLKVKWWIVN